MVIRITIEFEEDFSQCAIDSKKSLVIDIEIVFETPTATIALGQYKIMKGVYK